MGRGSAKTAGPRWYANTSDRALAPDPHQRARTRRLPDGRREIDHIGRSERADGQRCVEQLIDHLATRGADLRLDGRGFVGGDDDACTRPCWRKRKLRTVKEGPAGSRFRMDGLLIRWEGKASLDLLLIEETVVTAGASHTPVQLNRRQWLHCHIDRRKKAQFCALPLPPMTSLRNPWVSSLQMAPIP